MEQPARLARLVERPTFATARDVSSGTMVAELPAYKQFSTAGLTSASPDVRNSRSLLQGGWRCIAPDLRGYGGSSVPNRVTDYSLREVVADMIELHGALGREPAIWVGHSLGCTVGWAMATNHADRCRGIVNLTVPHLARGNALPNLVPLIDRPIYPIDRFPYGRGIFTKDVREFEANAARVVDMSYTRGLPDRVAGRRRWPASARKVAGFRQEARRPRPKRATRCCLPGIER